MRDVKAILFDAGGTLIEGAMPWYELYQQALTLTDHPMSERAMVEGYEKAIRRMTADKQTAVSAESPAATRAFNSYLADAFGLSERRLQMALDEVIFDHPEARHLVPAVAADQVLHVLRERGYRLGVISNWSADLPRVLQQLGLRDCFDAVFASESLGHAKPAAAAFLVPLSRMGLTPGESAYVGDLYDVDVLGSREVGMWPVLVDRLELRLHNDVTTVTELVDLLNLFHGV